jgi:alpha-maltose-1-phosphate synthase
VSAAIHFELDAYQVNHGKPMGRHFAGLGFLSALARHSSAERLTGYVRTAKLGEEFAALVRDIQPGRTTESILTSQPSALSGIGCLYTPGPINATQAWQRELVGPRSWSLCGVNHTLSSARAMDAVTDMLVAPLQPWDAVVCTSRASQAAIRRLLERQAEHLSRRLGATRFVTPQLPIIPLGVDCKVQNRHSAQRDRARVELGLAPEDVVVLFLGRLSFHAKANPAPMYMALEQLASRRRMVLVECGWAANDHIVGAFAAARAKLCPSVRAVVLDGRLPEARSRAWASADIFCSLSDNIQETFGLTPIEAMAAGLPVVVSDWDGYKDTVRDGIDGFTVPTVAAPSGSGQTLAARHALEIDSYDLYIGQASTGVAIDVEATAAALDRLASDPELRRSLGANGAARAREIYDWAVIIRAYERLWRDLAELRRGKGSTSPPPATAGFWPARPDPFDLFASFASETLSLEHLVVQTAGIDGAEAAARLGLKLAFVNVSSEVSDAFLLNLWRDVGAGGGAVRDLIAARSGTPPHLTVRGLMWLAKFDLVRLSKPET